MKTENKFINNIIELQNKQMNKIMKHLKKTKKHLENLNNLLNIDHNELATLNLPNEKCPEFINLVNKNVKKYGDL